MAAFYLARQPIYDSQLRVAGYELLFRGEPGETAKFSNGDLATSEVITSSVIDIGLDNLVGEHPAFINATRGFLDGELPLPHLKHRLVLEVLEDIEVDAALVERLTILAREGYSLALDDFVYQPRCEPLLPLVDYVKLDVQALSDADLAGQVARVRGRGARLIAEKVEDYPMLARCRELGFDMFQGFFFCRPSLISGRRPEANRLAVLQLIARLRDPGAGLDELERLVSSDPALCYRLLKYINSGYCSVRARVTSIRQALILAGTDLVRSWATLLLLSRLTEGKPSELITTALVRARMCELLGEADPQRDSGEYFTVGLMSVLDAMLDLPMADVVAGLPLDDEISGALSEHRGPLGAVLRRVLDYELGLPAGEAVQTGMADAYVQALAWAAASCQGLR